MDDYVAMMQLGDIHARRNVEFGLLEAERDTLRTNTARCYQRGADHAMGVVAALWETDREAALVAVHATIEALEAADSTEHTVLRRGLIAMVRTLVT